MADRPKRVLGANVLTYAGQSIFSFKDEKGHRGIDLALPAGAPIRAVVDGVVVDPKSIGLSAGYGRAIVVRDAQNRFWIYGHSANGALQEAGERVGQGQVLGYVNDQQKNKHPGEAAEGDHLHLEIRQNGLYANQIDPITLPEVLGGVTNEPATMGARQQGAGNVADDTPKTSARLDELNRQKTDLEAQVAAKRQLLERLRSPQYGASIGPPSPGEDTANPDDLQKDLDRLDARLATVSGQLATEQDRLGKDTGKADTAPTTRQGPDGREYQWDAGKGQWVPAPGIAAPSTADKARRTQIVDGNLIDLDTGQVIAQVPRDAKDRRTQVVGNQLIDLDTGQKLADLPESRLAGLQADDLELKLAAARRAREIADQLAARTQEILAMPDGPDKTTALTQLARSAAAYNDPGALLRQAHDDATLELQQQRDAEAARHNAAQEEFSRQQEARRQQEAERTYQETVRSREATELAGRQSLAMSAANEAARLTEAHNKEFLPAEAAAGLQPIYEAFASGQAPQGLGPTILPKRETPDEVSARVYRATMEALAQHSPLAAQNLAALNGGMGAGDMGYAPTVSTSGSPDMASMLNASTQSVVDAGGGQLAPYTPPAAVPTSPPSPESEPPIVRLLKTLHLPSLN